MHGIISLIYFITLLYILLYFLIIFLYNYSGDIMDCIFDKIVNGDIPSFKLYEDDLVIAFLDINPSSNGHTLVVPKIHYTDVFDIPNDTLLHIFDVARNLMNILKEKLNCDGFTLIQNNGIVEEVKYFHLHIKPAYLNEDNLVIRNVEDIYNIIKTY